MKTKFFFATMLIAGAALVVNAQGYKDGIDFYKIGKLDDAQELLERNLDKVETNKAEAYYYLGQVALKKGDTGTAKSYYDKGVQANPNFALNYVGQGAVAIKNGNAKEAENLFKQAEKLAVVLGTEGDGLRDSTIGACDYTVRIPMEHGVDSLNVAASSAVAFWELRKSLKAGNGA